MAIFIRLFLAILRILQQTRANGKSYVYVFLGPGLMEILFCLIMRLANIPIVQEINEWWPGNNNVSKLAQWFRAGNCLFLSKLGTIVISQAIEERLRSIVKSKNIKNNILRIPVPCRWLLRRINLQIKKLFSK